MIRMFLFGCLISGLTATASAEEYILQLEEMGYIDQPEADPPPKETTIRSIEGLVEPNKPFHFKMKAGKETITFSGKLQPSPDENVKTDFEIEMEYEYRRELESAKNQTKPAITITRFNTSLGIDVGKPVKATEVMRARNKQPDQLLISQVRHVLVLTKYNPSSRD